MMVMILLVARAKAAAGGEVPLFEDVFEPLELLVAGEGVLVVFLNDGVAGFLWDLGAQWGGEGLGFIWEVG